MKSMGELIEEIRERELLRDYRALRFGPRLGRLSALGLARALQLMRQYGRLDRQALASMGTGDVEDLLRLRAVMDGLSDLDPFGSESEALSG